MLPNEHNIYLHDTPARALFSRTRRDFSHGCIRLADPFGLAWFLLHDRPEWTAERIYAAIMDAAPITSTHNKMVVSSFTRQKTAGGGGGIRTPEGETP